jgi:hypothetical protein
MCRDGGLMLNAHVVAASAASASVTWSVKPPATVGVPVIAPVVALKVRPFGNVPSDSEKA